MLPQFLDTTNVELIHNLSVYFIVAASTVFALVAGFIIYYLFKYRESKNPGTPEQLEGSQKVEISLTIVATLLTALFAYLTLTTIQKVHDIPENPKPFMTITGHQWWWEVHYNESGAITANQIHIPTGKKILLALKSADVIHSFWVQKLGPKLDMIPGNTNHLWIYAEKPGEYLGTCSEFCGTQHANMRIRVTAQSPEDFKNWQDHQLNPVVSTGDSLFLKGKHLFEQKTCTSCHAINGTSNTQNIGPNLTHFASRKRFLADMKENNEENVRAWLENPQHVKHGARMPNFIFSDNELDALVAYIDGLK